MDVTFRIDKISDTTSPLMLAAALQPHPILYLMIIWDPRFRNAGHALATLEFANAEAAEKALAELHGSLIDGARVEVTYDVDGQDKVPIKKTPAQMWEEFTNSIGGAELDEADWSRGGHGVRE
jgi:hypothetical protein